jgi:excisionase family DNA binding protein
MTTTAKKRKSGKESGELPEFVGVPWFAKRFSVARTTIYNAIAEGRLKAIRIGDAHRIPSSEVERVTNEGL